MAALPSAPNLRRQQHASLLALLAKGLSFNSIQAAAVLEEISDEIWGEDLAPSLRTAVAQSVSESTSSELEPKRLGQDFTRFTDFLTERQWLQLQASTAMEEAQAVLYPVLGRLGLRTPSEPTWGAIMTFLYLLLGLTFPEPLACYQELQKMKPSARKILGKGGDPPVMVWILPESYQNLPEQIRHLCFEQEVPVVCKIAREKLDFASLKVSLRKSDVRVQAALQKSSSSNQAANSSFLQAVQAAQLVASLQSQPPAAAAPAVRQQPQMLALMDKDMETPAVTAVSASTAPAAADKSVLPAAKAEAAPETSSDVPKELQKLREELGQSEKGVYKRPAACPAAARAKKKPAAAEQAASVKSQPGCPAPGSKAHVPPGTAAAPGEGASATEKFKPGSSEERAWRLSQGIPRELLQKYRSGCSKCRWRAGCTPCCWRYRGFEI